MSEQNYLNLIKDITENGFKKTIFSPKKTIGTINKGVYTEEVNDKYLLSLFGAMLRFDCSNGSIPIFSTKRVAYKSAFKEMLWFLNGNGDVAKLHNDKCTFWDSWAYQYYLKMFGLKTEEYSYDSFIKDILESGEPFVIPVPYTDFTSHSGNIDQTKWIIDSIAKTPDRKSFVASAWNPSRLYAMASINNKESVVLAACHCEHQVVINNNTTNLRVTIRSSDSVLGLPANVAQYGMLLHMYAKCTGYPAGELLVQLTDVHVYSDQLGEDLYAQLNSTPKEFPTLEIQDRGQKYLTDFVFDDFKVIGYKADSVKRFNLTVVGGF